MALTRAHWESVARIYAEGIAGGDATFETEVPTFAAWDAAHDPGLRLVALEEGEVVGFAVLAPVSARAVYAGVAESSVYVAPAAQGRGVGRALSVECIDRARARRARRVALHSTPWMQTAHRLYESLGFVRAPERDLQVSPDVLLLSFVLGLDR